MQPGAVLPRSERRGLQGSSDRGVQAVQIRAVGHSVPPSVSRFDGHGLSGLEIWPEPDRVPIV